MNYPTLSATLEKGKLKIDFPELLKKILALFKEGQKLIIIIKPWKKQRSRNQNSYYWGVLVKTLCLELWGSEAAEDMDSMHHELRRELLYEEMNGVRKPKSTQKLNTAEAEKYYEDVRRFATTKFNIYLPLPNEVDYTEANDAPNF